MTTIFAMTRKLRQKEDIAEPGESHIGYGHPKKGRAFSNGFTQTQPVFLNVKNLVSEFLSVSACSAHSKEFRSKTNKIMRALVDTVFQLLLFLVES